MSKKAFTICAVTLLLVSLQSIVSSKTPPGRLGPRVSTPADSGEGQTGSPAKVVALDALPKSSQTVGPRVESYSNSGCLPGRNRDECGEDEIELTVEPGTLHILHGNALYNCCIEDIVISLTVEGTLLKLTEEEELLNGGCDCLCCYNVEATVIDLEPGVYTVEFCWYDYDIYEQRCYVEEIEVPPPPAPHVASYSNTGCLPERDLCGEDEIEFTVEPGTLHVFHANALYNCCPDDIIISLSVDGTLLKLTEEEILEDGGCYCVCCYNVEATVIDLTPGPYTVEFCWYDYDIDEDRCYVEDIVIP